jgi:drug/metabolite transporter (DMT)-like permease
MRWTALNTINPQSNGGIYFLAVLTMLFWGLSFVWSTIVFKYYDPLTTIFLRLVISSAILILYIKAFKLGEKIERKDYGFFLLCSLFNPFLYFLGENYGLKLTSPSISAVVIATIPVFTPIAAAFILKERLTLINIMGIVLSFTGILIMIVKPDMSIEASPAGFGLLMLAVLTAVIYSILIKKLVTRYKPITIITAQNILGIVYFLPFFLFLTLDDFLSVTPNFELISSLLQLAIFASSLAFIFFTKVIRSIGVSKANVFSNLIPVFTAIFSVILVSETFSSRKIIGILIIMSGILVAQIKRKRKQIISG